MLDGADDGCGKEGCPGEEPEDEQKPEDRDGDLAVVVRDAAAEEARDVLVVEIEPGPAGFLWQAESGRHGDGRVAKCGKDVPGKCDGKEEKSGGDDAELAKEWELAGEGEVKQNEGDGEDNADEALGEEVEGEHGGEPAEGIGRSAERFGGRARSRAIRKRWTARVIQRAMRMSGM